jgi:hypothetical protein
MAARRIDPGQARREIASGNALFVCAYDDEERWRKYRLPEALSLTELKVKEAALPKDQEIIFYCA